MIQTERLLILPLTYDQLQKYLKNDASLDEELALVSSPRVISPELKEAMEQTIMPNVADKGKNYLFSTLWTVISKTENKMVGDLCFVGEPNEAGEIEIGYGMYDGFRDRGFMTEAVAGMIAWVQTQSNVKSIFAATEKNNHASSTVLLRNHFQKFGETDTLYNWRLKM